MNCFVLESVNEATTSKLSFENFLKMRRDTEENRQESFMPQKRTRRTAAAAAAASNPTSMNVSTCYLF